MGYLEDWTSAKKQFETATGKKKPSQGFLGAFKKSSGLETATKGLDKALANFDAKTAAKAEADYTKAWQGYLSILEKADKDDKDADYKAEIGKLKQALEKIALDFTKAKGAKAEGPRPLADMLGDYYTKLIGGTFAGGKGVKWFATAKEVITSGATGEILPEAKKTQDHAAECLTRYTKAVAAIKADKGKSFEPKKGYKHAAGLCSDIGVTIGPMEGFQNALASWREAQQNSFKKAGKEGEFAAFIKDGPLTPKLKTVRKECEDELVRINDLEAALNRHF